MEQLIKDLEKAWESFKDDSDHARVAQMVNCLYDIVGTAEIIKTKAIRMLDEMRLS